MAVLPGLPCYLLKGDDVLYSLILCPRCVTERADKTSQQAELSTFHLSSAGALESHQSWQVPPVGCGDEAGEQLEAGWPFPNFCGHCSIKKTSGATQMGSAEWRGFSKHTS